MPARMLIESRQRIVLSIKRDIPPTPPRLPHANLRAESRFQSMCAPRHGESLLFQERSQFVVGFELLVSELGVLVDEAV